MRALRPDKLAIAWLAATLALVRAGTPERLPVLAMLARTDAELQAAARALAARIPGARVERSTSTVGGGAMPTAQLPSWAVTVGPASIEAKLRAAATPILARVEDGRVWLDLRTIGADEHDAIVATVVTACSAV
ncbi:MAG: hypothetical protein NT062_06205 [Proteobacteria bacterium]|nr:hypothetical protein [Pseudomonadota bacterium]